MKFVLQRVNNASVRVDGQITGQIDRGILALCGLGKEDNESKFSLAVDKISNMRIFSNADGKFDYSLVDIKGGILLVPQFTLFADTKKGRRPEFFEAMRPELASPLFDKLVVAFKSKIDSVQTGIFGADMKVSLENDGPVTITLDI